MSEFLVLVDGSSYLYRAFHVMPSLKNTQNEPTGAMYGVINMLKKLMAEHQPQYCCIVFDAKGTTFRDELFEQYKANRPPMPDELALQIEPLCQMIQAMGLPLLQIPGVEADDVIGTLACQAVQQGLSVLISTGDKDMAQLVNQQVTLVNTMTDTMLDVDGVKNKFGVYPEQIVDYLALIGDSVDNVPGVPKVGPKTAAKWLEQHQDLQTIMEQASSVKGKVGASLRDSLDLLPLSRALVTIKCDVELPYSPKELSCKEPDFEALIGYFKRYEFKTWLKECLNQENTIAVTEPEFELVLTPLALDKWVQQLQQARVIAFDTETTSLNVIAAKIVGVSVATTPEKAAYIPFAHDYEGAPHQLSEQQVLSALQPLLEDPDKPKLGHNLKYDINVLKNHGIELKGAQYDSMLESYVYDSAATGHGLDSLALKYLNRNTIHFEEVAGKGVKQVAFNQVTLEKAGPYAAEDAMVTLALHQILYPKVRAAPGLSRVFETIEMPLMPILAKMERQGVLLDAPLLRQQGAVLSDRIAVLRSSIHEQVGEAFNIDSPKQLQSVLYETLNLPVLAKTPKGQPSTAEAVLRDLAEEYVLPELILEYRRLNKLLTTYIEKLPHQVNARTGRIHPSFHQAITATGRLSCSDPNLQNIPIRHEEGRHIRQAFVVPEHYSLVAVDYSQIELRIMAHLSQDDGLLQAFAAGQDIHQQTAAELFSVELTAVTAEQRRSAKAINFGLIYGMSAFGLAKQLGVPKNVAQHYIEQYFQRYPGVKNYMEHTREQARSKGYVETLSGRRLYLPDIDAKHHQRKMAAERVAINAPMQGTAADIIKIAMIELDHWITESMLDIKMLIQVHDELVFELPTESVTAVVPKICQIMEQAMSLDVPLVVSWGQGKNWEQAH